MKKVYVHLSSFWKYYQLRRYAAKALPIIQKIMHLRYNTKEVNIKEYLDINYHMFNDDYQYVVHNGFGAWMVGMGPNNSLMFFRRDFLGAWYRVTFHEDQALAAIKEMAKLMQLALQCKRYIKASP